MINSSSPYKFKNTPVSSFVKDFYPTFELFITNHIDNSHLIQNEVDYHHLAIFSICDNNLIILKYLVELNKFSLDMPDLFRQACSIGKLDCVRYLVSLGVDITFNDYDAFGWAANNNHLSVVKFLVETGIDLTQKNPLVLSAIVEDHEDVAFYLIDHNVYFSSEEIQQIAHLTSNTKKKYIEYAITIKEKKEFHQHLSQQLVLASHTKIQPKI